jgi:four helix bundle protein
MAPYDLRVRLAAFARDAAVFARPRLARLDTRDAALQLKASSSSAAANHRAARKARSRREFVAKIGVAQEEADEAVFWLEHLVATGSTAEPEAAPLLQEARELAAILTRSYTTARAGLAPDKAKPRR